MQKSDLPAGYFSNSSIAHYFECVEKLFWEHACGTLPKINSLVSRAESRRERSKLGQVR